MTESKMPIRKFNGTDKEEHRLCLLMYDSGIDPSDTLGDAMTKIMRESRGRINPCHAQKILLEYGFLD